MPDARPIRGSVWEDSGCSLMARVLGVDGANITQASISSITYAVHNADTGAEVVASTSLTVASVVFDTLQTDSRWHVDSTGYNFRMDAPAASFPTGNTRYHVEVKFTPATGAVFHVVFEVAALQIFRS